MLCDPEDSADGTLQTATIWNVSSGQKIAGSCKYAELCSSKVLGNKPSEKVCK